MASTQTQAIARGFVVRIPSKGHGTWRQLEQQRQADIAILEVLLTNHALTLWM